MRLRISDDAKCTVDLSSRMLNDRDLEKLIQTDSMLQQASTLYLYNNNITDRGVMTALMNLPNLSFLDIQYNPISDHLISVIKRYRWEQTLRVCYFDHRTRLTSIVYLNDYDYSDNVMRLTMSELKGLSQVLKGLKIPDLGTVAA